ncbi:HORMA domain-containing protein 1 isoform X2 [Kryptolebias marmoratus]|uniref:HORMA domain-containing protein 1 isoform X2 n=1 Tax=Kryptolebias marmoratus TaxID=37003 RepID=UPI0007F90F09|nr:HORMA domain-containing protein 1 isoform X2 [Kryptolebias marmoratus]
MACAQQVRPSQTAQLLPTEVCTEQQSLVVIKRLLAIAVSGITYLRGIFPGRAYGSKYVEDQEVMILKGDRSCLGASQILQWMQGCFDAIQKKYLRTVIMSIYMDPENPQIVTEYYQFRIQYTTDGAHLDFESNTNQKLSTMSCGNTKKASILLVRKLYTLMQNLGPLPENVCLNMKLAYYEDVTPPDYQPPGFKEAEGDVMEFEQEPVKLAMGEVATPFHCVKFDMATEKQRLEQVEENVSVKEKWLMRIDEHDVITQGTAPKQVEKPDNKNTDLNNTEIQMSCNEKNGTCEEVTEMDTLVKKASDLDVGLKRTRSGRIIKSTMVSQYDILSSQESSAPVAKKKRKFSEPKDHC